MRLLLILTALLTVSGVLPAQEAAEQDTKALAEQVARQALAEASSYAFEAKGIEKFELREQPILKWSNTYNDPCYGSVFLWMANGRPAVFGSIYRFPTVSKVINAEFHSLVETPLEATRNGKVEWHPEEPGVVFREFEGAPAPAATAARRLTQMRDMAREFSCELTTVFKETHRLRLMTQPLFRYEAATADVSDGAIFSLARETDPEVLILLEARDGKWKYALARMNCGTLVVTLRGTEVWRAEELPNPFRRDRERYSLLKDLPLPQEEGE